MEPEDDEQFLEMWKLVLAIKDPDALAQAESYATRYVSETDEEWAAVDTKAQRYVFVFGAVVAWLGGRAVLPLGAEALTTVNQVRETALLIALAVLLAGTFFALRAVQARRLPMLAPEQALRSDQLDNYRDEGEADGIALRRALLTHRLTLARTRWRIGQGRVATMRNAERAMAVSILPLGIALLAAFLPVCGA